MRFHLFSFVFILTFLFFSSHFSSTGSPTFVRAQGDDDLDLGALLGGLFAPPGGQGKQRKGADNECDTFTCPTGHVAKVKKNYKATSNGCGSYGFQVPSKWHTPCCNQHDICFGTCNRSRSECDNAFLKCMKSQCTDKSQTGSKQAKQECLNEANMFYGATRALGCSAYQSSQKDACTCHRRGKTDL